MASMSEADREIWEIYLHGAALAAYVALPVCVAHFLADIGAGPGGWLVWFCWWLFTFGIVLERIDRYEKGKGQGAGAPHGGREVAAGTEAPEEGRPSGPTRGQGVTDSGYVAEG